MKLPDVVKAIRLEAKNGHRPNESRAEWQTRLKNLGEGLLETGRLWKESGRAWLNDVVRDATADALKRPGSMPRVAAGQVALWPEMKPIDGMAALRAYARKYQNVATRYATVVRFIGLLWVAYGDDTGKLGSYHTLMAALIAAGASQEDIAVLREIAIPPEQAAA